MGTVASHYSVSLGYRTGVFKGPGVGRPKYNYAPVTCYIPRIFHAMRSLLYSKPVDPTIPNILPLSRAYKWGDRRRAGSRPRGTSPRSRARLCS
jgi:hypothetical protein